MAKLTRNSYKRKVILFGVILFVSIALISTGFAAWIMSTNATKETPEGNVTVGQVTDSQLNIENLIIVEENPKFAFEPKSDDTTGRVRWDKTNGESLTIHVTGTVQPTEYLGELKYALSIPASVKKAADEGYIVLPEGSIVKTDETETWVVTDAWKDITPTTEQKAGGSYDFEITLTFTWGEKFKGQNPGLYYDEDPTGKTISDTVVKTELENLRAVIYGYDGELKTAVDEAARATVIEKYKNAELKFKVIVSATAN